MPVELNKVLFKETVFWQKKFYDQEHILLNTPSARVCDLHSS